MENNNNNDNNSQTNFLEELKEYLSSLSEEEMDKIRDELCGNPKPKGWLSIEEYLPAWLAKDLIQGYSIYSVRDINGNEFKSKVTDHMIWYYQAKDLGITHWLNE